MAFPDKKKGSLALMILGGKPKGMGAGDGAKDRDSSPGMGSDDEREGLESAADDILDCIAQKDAGGLVDALTSFIRMVKSGDEPEGDSADEGEG